MPLQAQKGGIKKMVEIRWHASGDARQLPRGWRASPDACLRAEAGAGLLHKQGAFCKARLA